MSNRNADRKKQSKAEVKVHSQVHMSAEELQHIIAEAIIEADKIKKEDRQKQQDQELNEWRTAIGYKEIREKNPVIRGLRKFFNRLCVFMRICFISKDKIKGDRFSFGLIKAFLEMTFLGAKWLLNLLTLGAVVAILVYYFAPEMSETTVPHPVDTIWVGVLTFLMSRLCRLASVEVEKLEDRNYLFSLVAAIASLVTVIGAAITIVRAIVVA